MKQNGLEAILDQASGSQGFRQEQIRMLEELLTASGAFTLFQTPPLLSTYGNSAHSSSLGLSFVSCQMELMK